MITRESDEILKPEEVKKYFDIWIASDQYKLINAYKQYYKARNPVIAARHKDKADKGKVPNNIIWSPYYKTVNDTMAGYLFGDIQYTGDDNFNEILKNNNSDVKDMKLGTQALAYNYAVEYIYNVGDGERPTETKFSILEPLEICVIYDTKLEPEIFCGIRRYSAPPDKKKNVDHFYYDVIYKNLEMYFEEVAATNGETKLVERKPLRPIYFRECPINPYKTNNMGIESPFDQIISYIIALDFLLTGNSDEVDKLTDAILKLSKQMEKKDLDELSELKALMGVKKDDVAEYITKNTSPEFRRYVSDLIKEEIHKHSHVIDWYNPDSGTAGAVSAKALLTRLFDMNMYSKQIEKIYKDGAERRYRLIASQASILSGGKIPAEGKPIEIEYNRTTPSDFEDRLAAARNAVGILSKQSIIEYLGYEWKDEQKRIEEEQGKLDDDLSKMIAAEGEDDVSESVNDSE